ncbi:hypothetical protein [Gloeomargarita lithophora]|uniref:hypothetical protein n=1 Tax=Gloeomargarita lithophora TaxID=1188228 RepID=UPI0008F843E0|nr:hypothetical protein [Gloeomargarita lithophora]
MTKRSDVPNATPLQRLRLVILGLFYDEEIAREDLKKKFTVSPSGTVVSKRYYIKDYIKQKDSTHA